MKTLAFLLLPSFSTLCLANAIEPLRAANTLAGSALYRWHVISADGSGVASSSHIRVDVDGGLDDMTRCDALFVVASYDFGRATTAAFNTQLRRAARRAVILGGLDTGAWMLASLGLLDGYRATVHWQELTRLEEAFPDVRFSPERYVIDRDRITAGGATTVLDLMLGLIRTHHGEALTIEVMRLFLYDTEQSAETPQRGTLATPLMARRPDVARAIKVMEDALETPLALPEVARRAGCSQRQLERHFAAVLGQTPQRYYRILRLTAARRLLQETGLKMPEIAERTGFSSALVFSRAFRGHYGHPPGRARRLGRGA